jgi:hypothetical protein
MAGQCIGSGNPLIGDQADATFMQISGERDSQWTYVNPKDLPWGLPSRIPGEALGNGRKLPSLAVPGGRKTEAVGHRRPLPGGTAVGPVRKPLSDLRDEIPRDDHGRIDTLPSQAPLTQRGAIVFIIVIFDSSNL